MPAGVVVPRSMDEALKALAICRDEGLIVTRAAAALRNAARPSTAELSSIFPST